MTTGEVTMKFIQRTAVWEIKKREGSNVFFGRDAKEGINTKEFERKRNQSIMYAKIEIPPFFLYSLEAALVLF